MKNILTEINALAYTKLVLNQSIVSEINRLFSFLLRLGCGVTLGKDTLIRDIEDMGTIPCRKLGVTITNCSNLTPNSELELLDVYVTCKMRMDKKNVKKTKSIKGTINPVFKESFEMNLLDFGESTCAIEVDVINAERSSKALGHGVGILNGLSLQRGVHESIDIDLDTDGKVCIKVVPINFGLSNDNVEMIEIDA
jgi:Ca2+-dependent lipid-binding protein